MKKLFYLLLLCSLYCRPGFAQSMRNPDSRLPANFESDKQAAYNRIRNPEVTFGQYYENEKARYYREEALRLDPGQRYQPGPIRHKPCGNGDFESVLDPNEWEGGYGNIDTAGIIQYASFTNGILGGTITDYNAHQTSTGTGIDPYMPINTTAPTGSTRAVRLGNAAPGAGAELLSKTFIVPADKSIISFWYALVLENPSDHLAYEQPAFRVRVLDAAGNVIPGLVDLGNGSDIAVSDVNNPFFMSIMGPNRELVAYRDWSCASINLSRLIGQQVTIQFVTNDCTRTGHFGYAYIDDFCGSCSSNPYNLSLAATSCGDKSQVCINYQLPAQGNQAGSVNIDLNIYQNGNLLTTLNSGTLNSGNSYCFNFITAGIPGLNTALGGFDYTAVGHFNIGTTALSPFYLFAPPDGSVAGQNNDCTFPQQCCPGKNLIINGGFEAGNTGFSSDFMYQPVVAGNSVSISQYSILTDAEAQTVASTWGPICPSAGRHLFANGNTGQPGLYTTVWKQTISLEKDNSTYKFCGDIKELAACAFNANSDLIFTVINNKGLIIYQDVFFPFFGVSACGWSSYQSVFTASGRVTLAIQIDETTPGDGNDIAIDNLSLVKLNPVPQAEIVFGLVSSNFVGSTYNLTATPSTALPAGCSQQWELAQVDPANNNAVIPGTTVTYYPGNNPTGIQNFPGYNGSGSLSGTAPGVFDISKTYRIVYTRSCSCLTASKYQVIFGPVANRSNPGVLQSGPVADDAAAPVANMENATTPVNQDQEQIRIFPNPTSGKVTIQKEVTAADYEVKVLNTLGQQVKVLTLKKEAIQTDFSLAGLAPGNYIVHIVSSKGAIIYSKKMTKL